MPNWTKNTIKAKSREDFIKLCECLINSEGEVDFNKLIPMPKELNIKSGSASLGEISFPNEKSEEREFRDLLKKKGKDVALKFAKKKYGENTIKYKNCVNICKYGYKDWYDWCCARWSTKWNASSSEVDTAKMEIRFETAWAYPEQVIKKLATKVGFVHLFSCEDDNYESEYEQDYSLK